MHVLIAPDKFKNSLSALEVCQAIRDGLLEQDKPFDIQMHPMADGGDGSLEVINQYLKLEQQAINTIDPLGRPLSTFYYTSSKIAFIEIAKASGIVLLKEEELNPFQTSTYGTGLMVADAISKGCEEIYLFLGGSATNDGGMGIASALGVKFYDQNHQLLIPCGESLSLVNSISKSADFEKSKVKFTLLCDVDNLLVGPNGAARIYARQKGADANMVQLLEDGMEHFSERLFEYSGINVAQVPGSGAAGGIAATLVSIFDANIKSGIERLIELTKLEEEIQKADIVISGEGKLDKQSFQGKVIKGISDLCKKHNKPLFLFVGKSELSKTELINLGVPKIYSIFDRTNNLEDAMENAADYLKKMAMNFKIKPLQKD